MGTGGAVEPRSVRRWPGRLFPTTAAALVVVAGGWLASSSAIGAGVLQSGSIDPAAWGSDHVGQPLPEYVTGDECLFCHRNDVGPTWRDNAHQRTMRELDRAAPPYREMSNDSEIAPLLAEATVEIGAGGDVVRFLKPTGRYGQLSLLNRAWTSSDRPETAATAADGPPAWDDERFGLRCAGCHATAVETEARAFSSPSLDCYTCHGAVDIDHGEDTSRMIFADGRSDPAPVIVSICGQCHVRTGRSRSSGLPYPNTFVAGDNLFRDFAVDLSPSALESVGPADRHVLENVRAVVVEGVEAMTCLTCHDVHGQSTERHEGLRAQSSCFTCHLDGKPLTEVVHYVATSELCEY